MSGTTVVQHASTCSGITGRQTSRVLESFHPDRRMRPDPALALIQPDHQVVAVGTRKGARDEYRKDHSGDRGSSRGGAGAASRGSADDSGANATRACSAVGPSMTFDRIECVIGEIRGFRWWHVTPRGWLRSPWHGMGRWDVGDNIAECVRPNRCYQPPPDHHAEGSPDIHCACGFYALHDVPTGPHGNVYNVWEIAAATSGTSHGLAFGVAAAHGHMLVGTTGWRAEVARVVALYAGLEGRSTRRTNAAGRRYCVPVYRNLHALAAEWGPESEALVGTAP